jgi:hypothetical protein
MVKRTDEYYANQLAGYNAFIQSWLYHQFINCHHKILGLFTGNKYGKTYLAARNYCDRIFGVHGVPRKNVLYFKCAARKNNESVGHEFSPKDMRRMFPHVGQMVVLDGSERCNVPDCGEPIHEVKRIDRIFRFASANLPMQGEDVYHRKKGATARYDQSREVKNVQHPAFRKLIPPYLVKKDCTTRAAVMAIEDPHCRGEILIDFTSYKQPLVSKTGQNLLSTWYDEQASEDEVSDGRARVVLEKGDQLLTCTPIDYTSFYFNEIFEQAETVYRTKTIIDFLEKEVGKVYPPIQHLDSKLSIGVFWAATDDNPLIDVREIEDLLMTHDDPIMNKIKRYGLFKQISGRIFPQYDGEVHAYGGVSEGEGNRMFNPFAMSN